MLLHRVKHTAHGFSGQLHQWTEWSDFTVGVIHRIIFQQPGDLCAYPIERYPGFSQDIVFLRQPQRNRFQLFNGCPGLKYLQQGVFSHVAEEVGNVVMVSSPGIHLQVTMPKRTRDHAYAD